MLRGRAAQGNLRIQIHRVRQQRHTFKRGAKFPFPGAFPIQRRQRSLCHGKRLLPGNDAVRVQPAQNLLRSVSPGRDAGTSFARSRGVCVPRSFFFAFSQTDTTA